ncbi:MAG: substrate-binding domain-containing protein [Chloroflexota bacterium]|nr:substrate-binding domain-containing protein [Chloroflexota bacterium]
MQETCPGTNLRGSFARRIAVIAVVALVAIACTNPAASQPPTSAAPPASEAPVSEDPASEPPASEDPASGPPASGDPSGESFKIGYISLGDSVPFVKLVSDSIQAEADKAGVEVVFCDSELDAAKALACAQNLRVQEVQAVLNFQLHADSSPEVCEAHGNLPTIAIDIVQEPCQVAFMGAENTFAGTVVGRSVGEQLQAENECEYEAVMTLESKAVGEVNTARTAGMVEGFEEICGEIDPDKYRSLDVGGTTDAAITQVGDALSATDPGGIVVILSLNDDMGLGALAAARTAGRESELRIGAQGADPSAWQEIACNPVWLADAAYFPERYGTILIPAVIEILRGNTVEGFLYTEHVAITKDNIREVYPETPDC